LAQQLVFLIRSLEAGGAERQLLQLVGLLDKRLFEVTVVTYYDGGPLAADLEAHAGVRRVALHKSGPRDVVRFVVRLVTTLRALKPHVVHGYMPDANVLAWLAGRLSSARVVWGLRASDVDFRRYRFLSGALFKAASWLSPHADLIIANSEAGRRFHVEHGYSGDRMIVIPNGIDVDCFRPDPEARYRLRQEWGVAPDAFVVGSVARLDPMKDHETYLEAAAILSRRMPEARFVIVGNGTGEAKRRLVEVAEGLGVGHAVIWLGTRMDMPAVYSAFDVAVSSSAFGEGFSNTLGEAMACQVPCVTTDVGDAATIVADTGRVVPRRDPRRLAEGIAEIAADDRVRLGQQARLRIEQFYSADRLAQRTTEALLRVSGRAL